MTMPTKTKPAPAAEGQEAAFDAGDDGEEE